MSLANGTNKKEEAAQGFGIFHPPAANEIPGKPGGFLTPRNRSLNFSNFGAKTAFAYNTVLYALALASPLRFALRVRHNNCYVNFLFFIRPTRLAPYIQPQFRRPPVLGVCGENVVVGKRVMVLYRQA